MDYGLVQGYCQNKGQGKGQIQGQGQGYGKGQGFFLTSILIVNIEKTKLKPQGIKIMNFKSCVYSN